MNNLSLIQQIDIWSISKLPDLRMEDDGATSGSVSTVAAAEGAANAAANAEPGVASASYSYQPTQSNAPGGDFASMIPDTYKGKEWVQNALKSSNPVENILKMYDNAQTLIGQRSAAPQIPNDQSPKEAWQSFYKAIGVPDDPTAYETPQVEWAPEDKAIGEYLAASRPDAFLTEIKKIAKDAGLTPKQFKTLAEGYDRTFAQVHRSELEAMHKTESQMLEEFHKVGEAKYGQEWNNVFARANTILKDSVSEGTRAKVQGLDANSMAIMAEAIEGIRQKYIKEDSFSQSGAVAAIADARGKAKELMANPAYSNPLHPQHDEVVKQVNALYKSMQK